MPERIETIFDEARRLASDARAAFLDRACNADPALRARVEALLAAADEADADAFLKTGDRAPHDPDATVDELRRGGSRASPDAAHLSESPGTKIGPYKLLQLIGEGGFGSVFMAEQEKPVARKVALKIIKLGMDTRQVIARFEAERQALALMDHPNIAKVLDAGATELGRPFFVMELCKGDPIQEYCDKNNLSIEDRLELFAQVCNAVQHAHTKGIIHRDIKPSNILVSTQDGRPNAKVIDFGIAKATASKLTEKTLFTEHKALIGTPEYMSPEQAEGSLDIDTRTDVYSLGVLLYELLTGTTPFSSKELRSAAYAEIQRIIREVEPPKPSTRLSSNAETIASVAARRHTEPKRLGTIVRGELDWIVMKALEKDRQRRYETANGLAMDIRRYLAGDAVVAAPPSTAYRFRKFVRRNRSAVTAGAVVALALVLGLAGTAWQAKRAANQRDLAEAAREAEASERAKAERERDKAERIASFMSDMLEGAGPSVARGRDITMLKEMMDAAAKRIEKGDLKEAPEAELRLRLSVGDTYMILGLHPESARMLDPAIPLARSLYPGDHLRVVSALVGSATLANERGDLDAAETRWREALEMSQRIHATDHRDVYLSLNGLSHVRGERGDWAGAEVLARQALEMLDRLDASDSEDMAAILSTIGHHRYRQGDLDGSEQLFRRSLAMRRRLHPGDHPSVVSGLDTLSAFLAERGNLEESAAGLREALDMGGRLFPPDHPSQLNSKNNLAVMYWHQGQLDKSIPLFEETLATKERVLGRGHPDTVTSIANLGINYRDAGRIAEAIPLLEEVLSANLRPDMRGECTSALISIYLQRGDSVRCAPLILDLVRDSRTTMPRESDEFTGVLAQSSLLLIGMQKFADAEPIARECLAIREKTIPDDWRTFNTKSLLGAALLGQKKYDEAEPLLLDGFRGMKERAATIPPQAATRLPEAAQRLVDLYTARGDDAKAAEWRATLADHSTTLPSR